MQTEITISLETRDIKPICVILHPTGFKPLKYCFTSTSHTNPASAWFEYQKNNKNKNKKMTKDIAKNHLVFLLTNKERKIEFKPRLAHGFGTRFGSTIRVRNQFCIFGLTISHFDQKNKDKNFLKNSKFFLLLVWMHSGLLVLSCVL
jgi:hypothetical protein